MILDRKIAGLFIALIGVLTLFLNVSVEATDYEDTLWVYTAARANQQWTEVAACTAGVHATCTDEQNAPDDDDRLYTIDGTNKEDWHYHDPDTTDKLIKYVKLVVRARCTATFSCANTLDLVRRNYSEGQWIVCTSGAGDTTVTTTKDTWTNFTHTHPSEPCLPADSSWQWGYLTDSMVGDDLCWGVIAGDISKGQTLEVSWAALIVYSDAVAVEEGQVIIIGAKDEEDYHNPRLACPNLGW